MIKYYFYAFKALFKMLLPLYSFFMFCLIENKVGLISFSVKDVEEDEHKEYEIERDYIDGNPAGQVDL